MWQRVAEAKPNGLIVVFRWHGFYVGVVDDSGDYIVGRSLPDGYMGLMDSDLWLSIPAPSELSEARLR